MDTSRLATVLMSKSIVAKEQSIMAKSRTEKIASYDEQIAALQKSAPRNWTSKNKRKKTSEINASASVVRFSKS